MAWQHKAHLSPTKSSSSWPLIAAWGGFVGFLLVVSGWVLVSSSSIPSEPTHQLELTLPKPVPLEEFVFSSTDDEEELLVSESSDPIWELVNPNLVEESELGLLPIIAPNGQQAWQEYGEPVESSALPPNHPKIAIIITGIGHTQEITQQALKELPNTITFAFSPYCAELNQCIKQVRDDHHEVLLTLPLESKNATQNELTPHTLLTYLPTHSNIERLNWILSQTGGYVGLMSAFGDQFLNTPNAINPLFIQLKDRGLVFVDNSPSTAPTPIAKQLKLPYLNNPFVIEANNMERSFRKLETLARQNKQALGIIHADANTIPALEQWSRTLEQRGIALVPLTSLFPPVDKSRTGETLTKNEAHLS